MRRDQPWKTNRARVLRANETSAEGRLWFHLRDRPLGGHKFARQVAIGSYFADCVCREKQLVVEVDGATHGTDAEIAADRERETHLNSLGYRVVRVTNADIRENMEGVLENLLRLIQEADG